MGPVEIEAFLNHLAIDRRVSASTQNQAFSALLYLYRQVLEIELPCLDALRARRPQRLPVVLSAEEVRSILDRMHGRERLMVELLYGTGMRLLECCRLRVKDVDFQRNQILVRDGKGQKDRAVPLPRRVKEALRRQVEFVRTLHAQDLAAGHGRVWLPFASADKYPQASRELGWQYLFPSSRLSVDPRDNQATRQDAASQAEQRVVLADLLTEAPEIVDGVMQVLVVLCWKRRQGRKQRGRQDHGQAHAPS